MVRYWLLPVAVGAVSTTAVATARLSMLRDVCDACVMHCDTSAL